MTDVNPVYHGEVRLLNWGESARTGMSCTLQLDDGPDGHRVHPLKGMPTGAKNGQRFAMVLVPIGDDEQPAPQQTRQPDKPKGGTRARQAGIMCNDPTYWPALSSFVGRPVRSGDEAAAAIRGYCGVESRAELDHCAFSGPMFDTLERDVKAMTPLPYDNPYKRA